MDEYERTLRALNQYRALAAAEDEELLPATRNRWRPARHMPAYLAWFDC